MSQSKRASSQAAWALITQGATAARVEAHLLRHMINRALALIEKAPHRERIYQLAGDLIQGIPDRLLRLETDLDRTAYALSQMGGDFFQARLSLTDRDRVQEALRSSTRTTPPRKASAQRLARMHLARIKNTPNQMSGQSTFTTLRSQKGLPGGTSKLVGDPEASPFSSLPQPSEKQDSERALQVPGPQFQKPSPVQTVASEDPDREAFMQLDPEAPVYTRPRTMSQPGEERGVEVMDQGGRLHIRRPQVLAGAYYRLSQGSPIPEVIRRWQEDGEKAYDNSMPQKYRAQDVWPYREYTWTRDNARGGDAEVGGQLVWLDGPLKWDALTRELKGRGWDPSSPLYIQIGRKGGVKVGEGNHRLAIARTLGLPVPVFFEYFDGRVIKEPHEGPIQVAEPFVRKVIKDRVEEAQAHARTPDEVEALDELSATLAKGPRDLKRLMRLLTSGGARQAKPQAKPTDRQHKQRGIEKIEDSRYEESRRETSGREMYQERYRRKYDTVLDQYAEDYRKHPGRHKRRATFYREEFPSTPKNQSDGVGIVDSESGVRPGGGWPLVQPRSDGSAKVVPDSADRSWKNAASVGDMERGLSQDLLQRAQGVQASLSSKDEAGSLWIFKAQGSKGDYEVQIHAPDPENVRVACECSFWRWQGPEHWAKQGGYLYGEPRGTASKPVVKDPQGGNRLCKHALAALRLVADQVHVINED